MTKMRLKKGDLVIARIGKHKGKTGKILAVHPADNKVTVEGMNVVKRHTKPTRSNPQGGIIEKIMPMWASKVALVDPSNQKPTKIGYKLDAKGGKQRIAKQSGKEIK